MLAISVFKENRTRSMNTASDLRPFMASIAHADRLPDNPLSWSRVMYHEVVIPGPLFVVVSIQPGQLKIAGAGWGEDRLVSEHLGPALMEHERERSEYTATFRGRKLLQASISTGMMPWIMLSPFLPQRDFLQSYPLRAAIMSYPQVLKIPCFEW